MNKVLVVDDNPMILSLLERALTPIAAVSTSRQASEAFSKALADPPDLIITDYHMPGMDGCALLETLRATPATASIPVIMAATRTEIGEHLKALQASLDDFLEKPFFIADATRRIRRVLERINLEKAARSAPGEDKPMFRGSLAEMGVIDLLQSMEMSRKTCALTLTVGGARCDMYFNEGQIAHAVCGDLKGDEAVYQALAWEDPSGRFQIDFAARTTEQTTTRSTQGLLMEGMRLLDEANRDA
jgi:CheY-like chemotaxis protein